MICRDRHGPKIDSREVVGLRFWEIPGNAAVSRLDSGGQEGRSRSRKGRFRDCDFTGKVRFKFNWWISLEVGKAVLGIATPVVPSLVTEK